MYVKGKSNMDTYNGLLSKLTVDPVDNRDYLYEWSTIELPAYVSLREYCGQTEAQLTLGSCTANATVSACEMFLIANKVLVDTVNTDNLDMSRLFNYYNSRAYSGMENKDAGSYERSALKSLKEHGICTEKIWPYIVGNVNTKPFDVAYQEALNYKIGSYYRILQDGNTVRAIKHALSKGYPVLLGITIDATFMFLRADQILQLTNSAASIGAHQVLIVGYNDADGSFTCKNSWGAGWCDGGYFRVVQDIVNKNCLDIWVMCGFAGYTTIGPDRTIKGNEQPIPVPPVEKKNYLPYIIGGVIGLGFISMLVWKFFW
jgi:C1A family cysteine protease